MPSLRNATLSDFQLIVRFLPESSTAFNMFKHTSSNKILSQSSNTRMSPLAELLYSVWYNPIGVIDPLTTSVLGGRPASLVSASYMSIILSTPNDLPTPGGPLTIRPLTTPFATASVIWSRIAKRSLILVIACSSVSLGLALDSGAVSTSFSPSTSVKGSTLDSVGTTTRIELRSDPNNADASIVTKYPFFPC